jgi:hypothetical protein
MLRTLSMAFANFISPSLLRSILLAALTLGVFWRFVVA